MPTLDCKDARTHDTEAKRQRYEGPLSIGRPSEDFQVASLHTVVKLKLLVYLVVFTFGELVSRIAGVGM